MAQTFVSAKALALACDTDAKSMRRFIRAQASKDDAIISACGQGNRYAITPAQAKRLVAAFRASKRMRPSDEPFVLDDDEQDEQDA